MALKSGTELGNYEILSLLGKGGMGEVWRARDQKLGREVAIKTLPEEFAKDEERLARFEREAKLLASLNHPNIATIHGLEEHNGTRFLVLELVEGDTLRDRLARGPIPVQESLRLALQIAEALEAAHEKGVIHRDLKPANIKVTPDGKIKVLDFGLAKAVVTDTAREEAVTQTLTTVGETRDGVLLGTPAYMSPEQARRQAVDHRSDVWTFGSVLFEILTGSTLFEGPTVADTITGILSREPDLTQLPLNIHPGVRQLVRLCLSKNPKGRWQAMGDVRLEIQEVLRDPDALTIQPVRAARPGARGVTAYALAGVVLAFVAAAVGWYARPQPPQAAGPVIRFDYELPEGQVLDPNLRHPLVAVSPNGERIVYVANSQLYLWTLEQGAATPVSGIVDGPVDPAISPDGMWIGYFSRVDGQIKKVSVDGGAPFPLADVAPPYMGASWNVEDTIVYADRQGVLRVSAAGGDPQLIVPAQRGETLSAPWLLPDRESMLLTVETFPSSANSGIVVLSLESGDRKLLVQAGLDGRYLPTGYMVYTAGDVVYAARFNLATQELGARAVAVMEDVLNTGRASYSIGHGGTLAYLPGETTGYSGVVSWLGGEGGEVTALIEESRSYRYVRLSPAGDRLAALIRDENGVSNVWIHDVGSGTPLQLTDDARPKGSLAWSPDGERVTYSSDEHIYLQRTDGTEPAELLWTHDEAVGGMNWSTDGNHLAFDTATSLLTETGDIWVFSPDAGTALRFTETDDVEAAPAFSPDGRWISYVRRDTGGNRVWVAPHPGPGPGRQISTVSGGVQGGWSAWSEDGQALYYRGIGPNFEKIMTVSVETGVDFTRREPQVLFDLPSSSTVWDLHPDGEQFLVLRNIAIRGIDRQNARINVVVNWFQELKERVPVR